MPAVKPITVDVDLSQFKDRLKELGRRANPLIRRAMYAGGVMIRDAARAKVPQRTGALRKSIIVVTNRKGSNRERLLLQVKVDAKAFRVGAKGRAKTVSKKVQKERGRKYVSGEIYPRNYAHLVEYGTKPHMIGKVFHPGAQPKPFMRPAFHTQAENAKNRIIHTVFVELEKEAGRIAKRRPAR